VRTFKRETSGVSATPRLVGLGWSGPRVAQTGKRSHGGHVGVELGGGSGVDYDFEVDAVTCLSLLGVCGGGGFCVLPQGIYVGSERRVLLNSFLLFPFTNTHTDTHKQNVFFFFLILW
jgi:hypothetical protein